MNDQHQSLNAWEHETSRPPQDIVSNEIQHPAVSHHGMPATPTDAPLQQPRSQEEKKRDPEQGPYAVAVDASVVEKIAARAVSRIDGVVSLKGGPLCSIHETLGACPVSKGAKAEICGNEVCIEVAVVLKYGTAAKDVFEAVKKDVIPEVESLTGLKVNELTVRIAGMMDEDEIARMENKPTPMETAGHVATTLGSTLSDVAETVVSTVKVAHSEAKKAKAQKR